MKRHKGYQVIPSLAIPLCLLAGASYAADGGVVISPEASEAQAAIEAYWTPERMETARPRDMGRVVGPEAVSAPQAAAVAGPAGFATGCRPSKTSTCESIEGTLSESELEALEMADPMVYGPAPTNPLTGPYGPFQRWGEHLAYTAYPKSTVGKLFFTLNGLNYVCSASVIGRSTLATAGHCVSDGARTYATNLLFCPSYQPGSTDAARKPRGCWAYQTRVASSRWHNNADPDYDYACIVTRTTGTGVNAIANKIGNVTGWLGRAWNWSSQQPTRTFGYPQAAPFAGDSLQTTASTEWYDVNFVVSTASPQVSKAIGSDLTGGSSGGPWMLSWTGNYERADSDGSSVTDPAGTGGPYINGVNSHKRCRTNCNTPPTATSGIFWQEMTSPPFRSTTALGESEDVFATCLAHVNNN